MNISVKAFDYFVWAQFKNVQNFFQSTEVKMILF